MGEQAVAEPSDAALISRIRTGDNDAYALLYERHKAAARGLARHLISSDTEVDDAVSETFTKVLSVIQRGGGPGDSFRPYLLTSVRRTVYDRHRAGRRENITDEIELYDPGVPFVDPALEGLEQKMIVRAYLSLPERWQAVLWHTEIEGRKPADVAPLLGLSANGVAALAYRAREGLKQAYLQMHLAATPPKACRPTLDILGAYVRGGLAKKETARVEAHLDDCSDCRAIYLELKDLNRSLRTLVGPLILGVGGAAYLLKGGIFGGALFWWKTLPKRQQQALAGGTAVAVAVAAGLLALPAGNELPLPKKAEPRPPAVARPQRPAPVKPAPAPAPVPKPVPAPGDPAVVPPPVPRPVSSTPSPRPSRLDAEIGTVGVLLRGKPGIVAMTVRNSGGGASRPIAADVALPPGVGFTGGATGRTAAAWAPLVAPGGGWSCRPMEEVLRCAHGPLRPRATASAYLHVLVADDAPLGPPVSLALRQDGGKAALKAEADRGVQEAGMPARFATDGNVRIVQAGNALMSCPAGKPGCEEARNRKGTELDNDFWPMKPIDLDDAPGTASSSAADLTFGGKVLWAGLYWSGVESGEEKTARLRVPGGAYTTVKAQDADAVKLPGYGAYQAFADVTSKVTESGRYWVADVPTRTGVAKYAGWSLVVVVSDPAAPLSRTMILDGPKALGPTGADRVDVPVDGLLPAAIPARIGVVAWEGDAQLGEDRVLLSGDGRTAATSLGGANAFVSSAAGAVGPRMTYGVDVVSYTARLRGKPLLSLTTKTDAYVAGVVTVTAPLRS
ncbi:sigma-70 family RNA polymerase sigma factor [Actinocorallia longicatena]|uniref:RNA polymerase sigma factor (Sigma-70 family) n=1 Tax=Actinocorallia longicatena TaxID=111803 RepID=A0ABP6QP90_9ACTN